MTPSRDNIYVDDDNRIIYFADDVWYDTIGKTCAILLSIIESDNKKDEEQKDADTASGDKAEGKNNEQ